MTLLRARLQRSENQSGINMVDLMMWLVIAALLLAAALQSIGFYQQRAYIEQMMNDAQGAGSIALARASTEGGITETVIRDAVKETATSGDVSLITASLGGGHYAVEAVHPLIDDHRVIYSFSDRANLVTGLNLKKMAKIAMDGLATTATACPTNVWFAQYYSEFQSDGVPTEAPELERCETAPIGYSWDGGGPAVSGMPTDRFSIHWTKSIEVAADSEYEFIVSSDNMSWIYLDGKQIIDNSIWYSGSVTTQKATVRIPAGKHSITVRYVENGGGASVWYSEKVIN